MLGTLKNAKITKGFVLAGLFNMTVLVFSRFFTNPVIPESDPVVMSNFGLVMIVVWGLAYISVAKNYHAVKWLVAVFAVEKLIYGIVWTKWILKHELSAVYAKDTMAGIFYTIYGLNDWVFFIFFSYVFLRLLLDKNS
ncbi:hypothetical protein [Algoriphagus sp.]|uniref:hypothetical protein n=1 Tax=Algoriphagus sp. TaxID=1872435 RepID=UPI002720DEEA|nr:hypothetical protein [Algoriphagus sp.]MDO8967624.1 hypothetical protein [Algoriphagus sp.]MDP3198575.1 hypothetical protein [Algoriphagus sp.]